MRGVWLLALALVVLAGSGWAGGPEAKYSGAIVAVDQSAGTIVLGEIGPWHVKGGETEITRRTIAVTAFTEFARVKRVAAAGPAGWRGDFVETRLPAWQVKTGDFVTVVAQAEGQRLTAVKITVVEPGES
jgi:hypothetical protein